MARPIPACTDNRGTTLAKGQTVAYNLSGQIAIGTIVGISTTTRYGQSGVTITIELAHSAAGMSAGHQSKVKNEKNVMVLVGMVLKDSIPDSCPNCGQTPIIQDA